MTGFEKATLETLNGMSDEDVLAIGEMFGVPEPVAAPTSIVQRAKKLIAMGANASLAQKRLTALFPDASKEVIASAVMSAGLSGAPASKLSSLNRRPGIISPIPKDRMLRIYQAVAEILESSSLSAQTPDDIYLGSDFEDMDTVTAKAMQMLDLWPASPERVTDTLRFMLQDDGRDGWRNVLIGSSAGSAKPLRHFSDNPETNKLANEIFYSVRSPVLSSSAGDSGNRQVWEAGSRWVEAVPSADGGILVRVYADGIKPSPAVSDKPHIAENVLWERKVSSKGEANALARRLQANNGDFTIFSSASSAKKDIFSNTKEKYLKGDLFELDAVDELVSCGVAPEDAYNLVSSWVSKRSGL